MHKTIDISGKKFGRLLALRQVKVQGKSGVFWECKCDCGEVRVVLSANIRRGLSRSCGCLALDSLVKRSVKHGAARTGKTTDEYRIWSQMRQRCSNPKEGRYYTHGARGIRVCERWLHSFENFLEDMGPKPGPDYSLDRKENDGNYEPGNCRWATRKQQARNKRNTRHITMNGTTKPLTEWCEEFGLDMRGYKRVFARLTNGKSPEEAFAK